jgi:hypothetical protein
MRQSAGHEQIVTVIDSAINNYGHTPEHDDTHLKNARTYFLDTYLNW